MKREDTALGRVALHCRRVTSLTTVATLLLTGSSPATDAESATLVYDLIDAARVLSGRAKELAELMEGTNDKLAQTSFDDR